jgi:hypothetical protein
MVANFPFSHVLMVSRELGIMIQVSNRNMKFVEEAGGYNSPRVINDPGAAEAMDGAIRSVELITDWSDKLFSGLKCSHIDGAARRLRAWLKQSPAEWSELNTRARALRDAIDTEMKEHHFYQYPKEKGRKLAAWKTDWAKSMAAFPEISRDVFSAIDCYALTHDTASVFHSMRIAEAGLRALAKERRIKLAKNKPLEWGTWQEIIRALDEQIKVIGSKRAGAAKDAALEFYSGARADLNGFKDEYRNLVMHVRATYDEFQSLRALTNAHAFMERIAAKINHTHQRIRWGKF